MRLERRFRTRCMTLALSHPPSPLSHLPPPISDLSTLLTRLPGGDSFGLYRYDSINFMYCTGFLCRILLSRIRPARKRKKQATQHSNKKTRSTLAMRCLGRGQYSGDIFCRINMNVCPVLVVLGISLDVPPRVINSGIAHVCC